jgi:three-Cys-motif partner protein
MSRAPLDFFKVKRSASEIKSEILEAFFPAWCALFQNQTDSPANILLYIDLIAGPAFHPDQTFAGPARVLEQVYQSRGPALDLNAAVRTFFLDPAKSVVEALPAELAQLPYFDQLTHPPVVLREPAEQEVLAALLNQPLPVLVITDPFGYPYAQALFGQVVGQKWVDVLLVFTYAKMRAAVLAAGEEKLPWLGPRLAELQACFQRESSARKKEQSALQIVESRLQEHHQYTFTFKINLPHKDQTGHYLLLATNRQPAYLALKERLAAYSELQEDGVPLFIANQPPQPPLLPGFFQYLSRYTLENLREELRANRRQFHYRTIRDVYEEHSVGTNYIKANYLRAFAALRDQGYLNLVNEKNKQVKTVTENAVVFYQLHGRNGK